MQWDELTDSNEKPSTKVKVFAAFQFLKFIFQMGQFFPTKPGKGYKRFVSFLETGEPPTIRDDIEWIRPYFLKIQDDYIRFELEDYKVETSIGMYYHNEAGEHVRPGPTVSVTKEGEFEFYLGYMIRCLNWKFKMEPFSFEGRDVVHLGKLEKNHE